MFEKATKIILYLSKIIYETCNYISVSICRENLKEVMPFGVIIPHKSHTIFNKNSSIGGKRNSLLGCCLAGFRKLPKQNRQSLLPLIASQKLKVCPYCWKKPCASDKGLTGSKLDLTIKPPPWRLGFHSTRRCYVDKGVKQSIVLSRCDLKPTQHRGDHGTGNLANSQGPLRSWILEKSQPLPFFLMSIILNYVLYFMYWSLHPQ